MVAALLILIVLLTGCTAREVTLEGLLEEMSSRQALTYFPEPGYRLIQSSSYNRESVSPDSAGWFANADMSHFIRVEENKGRREFVMLDAEGPGAVVRWWMTFYKAQDGIIRIYIDEDSEPVLSGRPDSLLSGSLVAGYPFSASLQEGAPLGEEGRDYDHNFYFPLPFSKRCKITYECDSLRILYDYEGTHVPSGYYWPDVFYNICYRKYEAGTAVRSVSEVQLRSASGRIDAAARDLLAGSSARGKEFYFDALIAPGDSLVISDDDGPGSISSFSLRLAAENINQAMRSTVVKASFDGIASVWVPAGDFFGSGYTVQPHRTFMNRADSTGKMVSEWIMPFRREYSVSIVNYGADSVSVSAGINVSAYRWTKGSMYFGAAWHEHYNMRSRDSSGSPFDLSFIKMSGRGVYAGDQVVLYNDTYHWWGEGDEKIFVDGESFPSSFGTGSEDYYGYSFARQEAFSHPFLSQPVGIGNMARGVTINMRHRTLDAIPFLESLDSRIEMWHWADVGMNYALTSYFYFLTPPVRSVLPDPVSAMKSVAVTAEDFREINNVK